MHGYPIAYNSSAPRASFVLSVLAESRSYICIYTTHRCTRVDLCTCYIQARLSVRARDRSGVDAFPSSFLSLRLFSLSRAYSRIRTPNMYSRSFIWSKGGAGDGPTQSAAALPAMTSIFYSPANLKASPPPPPQPLLRNNSVFIYGSVKFFLEFYYQRVPNR